MTTIRNIAFALILGSSLPTLAIAQTAQNFYVDPARGNDTNSGTGADRAFRSISAAQKAVRKAKHISDITVHLRGGYYFVDRTLVFGPEDGGGAKARVVYRAYAADERPVISGGVNLTGKWSDPDGDGIFEAPVPAGTRSRNLYVGGTPASLAAGPSPFKSVTITDTGFVGDGTAIPAYRNPDLVEFVWPGSWKWRILSMSRAELIDGKTVVTMKQPGWSLRSGGRDSIENPGSPMHEELIANPTEVRNAFELLDQPGEWYLDTARDRIFYKPVVGTDMAAAETILAVVPDTLVRINGTAKRPVRNLVFENIGFAHATNLRPQSSFGHIGNQSNSLRDKAGSWEVGSPPATVHTRFADAVAFSGVHIFNSGTAGLFFDRGSKNGTVSGATIANLGGNGVQIGDLRRSIDDIDSCVGCNSRSAADRVTAVAVNNNHIYRIGLDAPNAAQAIHAAMADNVLVAHNDIHDVGYTPIALGYRWSDTPGPYGSNRVIANRLYDIVKAGRDGGGIYNVGNQRGTGQPTIIAGNHIFMMRHDFAALYPDEGSSDILWEGNVIENMGERTWLHNNSYAQGMSQRDLVIRNNFSDTPSANYGGTRTIDAARFFLPGARPVETDAIVAKAGLEPGHRAMLAYAPIYQAEHGTGCVATSQHISGFNGSGYALCEGGKPLKIMLDAGLGGRASLSLRHAVQADTKVDIRIGKQRYAATLKAADAGGWSTVAVPIMTTRGQNELTIIPEKSISLDQVTLGGTIAANGPDDLVPVSGALTRRSTIDPDADWDNLDRVVDGSITSGEAVAKGAEASISFTLDGRYRRITATLTEDNQGKDQVTAWRLQLEKDGKWVSLSPWLNSNTDAPQTYAIRRDHTSGKLRVLLKNDAPGGSVGLVEFRAFGADAALPPME
ncbi:hypothetical protein [Sphingobium algorifonticola]|uniref:Right-handed parallel beta-helix repeat-containing protein n=1 Tax=Sphingobium algorifonticola TaxID=2008318 RepID=A0A437JC24_9SPHN|nr:hypothetical protein [Sphingobium algorifonticola]RVT43457.1 hypothetical protein ENE74_02175 [Sphingobium algorifonticola]